MNENGSTMCERPIVIPPSFASTSRKSEATVFFFASFSSRLRFARWCNFTSCGKRLSERSLKSFWQSWAFYLQAIKFLLIESQSVKNRKFHSTLYQKFISKRLNFSLKRCTKPRRAFPLHTNCANNVQAPLSRTQLSSLARIKILSLRLRVASRNKYFHKFRFIKRRQSLLSSF